MDKNVNTEHLDSVVDRAAMLRLYEKRALDKVEEELKRHEERTQALLKAGSLTRSGKRALDLKLEKELKETYGKVYRASKKSLVDLLADDISFTFQKFQASVGKIWRVERPSRRVAEEFILEKPLVENQTLEMGWTNISQGERVRLQRVIRKGIAENKTIDEIAVEVRRGNVHSISKNQSKALTVTAITSVHAQADHAVMEANKDSLVGWQYVAVLDAATTVICSTRDGKIYGVDEKRYLPPAHYNCRSTVTPVFKSWADMAELENVSQIRRHNLKNLTEEEKARYDGMTPLKESYHDWLIRQPEEVQLRHLGDLNKVRLFQSGKVHLDKFSNDDGRSVGIRELRALTDSGYNIPGTTRRFADAKQKLDAMRIWASTPDDFYHDKSLADTLREYYLLQAGDLDGNLSLTNYRGVLLHNKRNAKRRMLTSPPREDQLIFNPITGRYEDVRMYQPNPGILGNALRLVKDSESLLDRDKEFILGFVEGLSDKMSINERAVVAENLRSLFGRQRQNGEVWKTFKGASQGQIKFDVMNISDSIETQLRSDADFRKKLAQDDFLDPVLGPSQLNELHDNFVSNIKKRNKWEDSTAPKVAREMQKALNSEILKANPLIWNRMTASELDKFYLKFVKELGLGQLPDRDQMAVKLGRSLYNSANINGDRDKWHAIGVKLLEGKSVSKFFEIETFGVQKRRMRSRMSGQYFGPYYDTLSYNLRMVDPRLQEYSRLNRSVEVGMRIAKISDDQQLLVRPGYKTFFVKSGFGLEDTRIPITSSSAFGDFPADFIDENLANALNWTSSTKYRVDADFYDFVDKLLYFEDDRGKAKHYNERNELRKYLASRSDVYERFKMMQHLRANNSAFSNTPFIDHRGRIYEHSFIGPQAGETFRPFLNTAHEKELGVDGFKNLNDQVGAFLGGMSDHFEGRGNALTFPGRQRIAEKWRSELVAIGNHMRRGKPADIRAILDSDIVSEVEGEELPKFLRFAIEMSKIDEHLGGDYRNLSPMEYYKTALALEQDASSSGAQIIAMTTRNKELAELSNVIPTTQKKRLYDEIARDTYNDPRFREMNSRLGLTEKDLRAASKMQNMVTLYGAGQKTGILNVERKLAKALGKQEGVMVINTSDRDTVLSEISAQIARYERFDPETTEELRRLRKDVKSIFDKGLSPGEQLMEDLWFLDNKTRDLVTKMSETYDQKVTPQDFRAIAGIMTEHMESRTPILKNFTRFFGRLGEDYLKNAKPKESAIDWGKIAKVKLLGSNKKGYVLPDTISEALGLRKGEPVSEKFLKRLSFWTPGSNLDEMLRGVQLPEKVSEQKKKPLYRRTGINLFKLELPGVDPKLTWERSGFSIRPKLSLLKKQKIASLDLFQAGKLPKSWTNIPFVNFDGKVLEQNYSQQWEQRLVYRDKDGNRITNLVQVDQRSEISWWDSAFNESGKIQDIADATRARTAYGVNANHSNDATLVKRFHLWGRRNNIPTSTIHDAFFTNAGEMLEARRGLRDIYADSLGRNVIELTLSEMLKRGFPKELHDKYLEEAKDVGLIPVPGRSVVGGKVLTERDVLKREDILRRISDSFEDELGWYGVG